VTKIYTLNGAKNITIKKDFNKITNKITNTNLNYLFGSTFSKGGI